MSWDVLLQKFDRGAEVNFDLELARNVLRRTSGFSELEQGVGEVEDDGFAEIYYGAEPSSDVMISVRAASPGVFHLVWEMATELRMVVFFPAEDGWCAALLDPSQADDLPDASWDGWENFGEALRPPDRLLCDNRETLVAALQSSYGRWEGWTHGGT